MMSFLLDSLDTTIRKLICIIVVKDVIDGAKHPRYLIKLDLHNISRFVCKIAYCNAQ